jgi:hypothetical protein
LTASKEAPVQLEILAVPPVGTLVVKVSVAAEAGRMAARASKAEVTRERSRTEGADGQVWERMGLYEVGLGTSERWGRLT